MAQPELDFTSRDFESIKQEMIEQIPKLAPSWTNLNESEPAMVLVNLLAGVLDKLSFYLDANVNEVYLPTARLRQSVARLARLLDYRMRRRTAATAQIVFRLDEPVDHDIVIPKYTKVATARGMTFVTKEETMIPAGGFQSGIISAYEGELIHETFTGTGESIQEYKLSVAGVADNFLEVYVNGTRWEEDKKVEFGADTALTYSTNTDDEEFTTIRFSIYGASVPSNHSTIDVYYLKTNGPSGNIGAGLINTVLSTFPDSTLLTVTNLTSATGGQDRESVEEAREFAPRSMRTLNRAVTVQDFIDLCEGFYGIHGAGVRNTSGHIDIYLTPEQGERLFVEPPQFTAEASPTDGALPKDTIIYVTVTSVDAEGKETNFNEYKTIQTPSSDTSSITVNIAGTPGAVSYKVYCGNVPGVFHFSGIVTPTEEGGPETYTITTLPNDDSPIPPAKNQTGQLWSDGKTTIKNALEEFLEKRRLVITTFTLHNAIQVPVDVEAKVTVQVNFLQSQVENRVRSVIAEYFKSRRRSFGGTVYVADLYKELMGVQGVQNLTLIKPAEDIVLDVSQIPIQGKVTLHMQGGS